MNRSVIAIDIDDVVAMTTEAVRVWANKRTGVTLRPEDYYVTEGGYWNYYEAVWERHGIADQLSFGDFLDSMDESQAHIGVVKDAREVLQRLKQAYDIVFITARRPVHKESTRQWIDEYIDRTIPLYLSQNPFANEAAQSKGEICAELGVNVLVDDNVENCQSAKEHNVEAVLFGNYGWNADAPSGLVRCVSWQDVEDYLGERE